MKICATCSREYSPSSRHKDCPKCRSNKMKNLCSCGSIKQGRSGQCIKCHNGPGESNPNWKGGRVRHKNGYQMVRVPLHPRAKSNSGYVFEHILVMEDRLGRYLLYPGENVHHKNGVRDDNLIENLELWVTSQPSGQRAEDLLAWAHEIIDRYEGL